MDLPVVALELTVITHGLPHPQNLSLALDVENEIRNLGVTPATVALLEGIVHIGLTNSEIQQLANSTLKIPPRALNRELQQMMILREEADPSLKEKRVLKVSRRDFAAAIVGKNTGGTTVAGTLFAAHTVGIKVFSTGGIGGVHEVDTFDISADLLALADTPMIVVCAGAKAILDLPATLEYLETMSVPVVGYQTNSFPAFYSRESGLPVSISLDSPAEIVEFARAHWDIGMHSAVLVCQPVPTAEAVEPARIAAALKQARKEARAKNIHGQAVTPFLLQKLVELTEGASLKANIALLLNNARLAGQIARVFSTSSQKMI